MSAAPLEGPPAAAPRSLLGEITLWSLGLLALGLVAIVAVETYAKRATAANLADLGLIDFLDEEIAPALALCPPGAAICRGQAAQNESGGIWSLGAADGRREASFSFAVSAFAGGADACARRDAREIAGAEIFTCAPGGADGIAYRVALRPGADGRPDLVALEEAAWARKVARAADHLAVWRSLRSALLAMAGTLVAALAATLLLTRARLARHFDRLGAELEAYRLGRAARLEGAYPAEIADLVASFNRALAKTDGLVARQKRVVQKMAHDLRHQLVNVDVAARSGEPGAASAEVEALTKLVERYLTLVDWVGPMEGQAPVDIGETLEAMRRAFARRLRAEPVEIEVAAPTGLRARVHPTDLKIILSNLLSNAHRHAAGRIRLSAAAAPDGALVLTVEDDGAGVPEAERSRILDWGARLDARSPGSGFGLTIVAEQVDGLYGGALALGVADLGGLRAEVRLPGAAAA